MKILFIFFFLLYAFLNSYIAIRVWQALQSYLILRILVISLIILFSLCFLAAMLLENSFSFKVASVVHLVGTTWFTAMIYFIMILLFVDLVKLSNNYLYFLPNINTYNYQKLKLFSFLFSLLIVVFILINAYHNYNTPIVKNINISFSNHEHDLKNTQNKPQQLKITAVSDIHLGFSVKKNRFKKYVELINSQNPDVILLVGDIVDRNLKPVIEQNMSDELSQLKAALGVYAVVGNHEMLGDLVATKKYLEYSGINILLDSSVCLEKNIWIVGRKDKSDTTRMEIKELVENLDKKYPIILLDHQPNNLVESQQAGIDLYLAGHTHAGQIFPNNLIVSWIYELAYGYKKMGNTHYYVSSGLGLWGAPFRISSRSEVVNINLTY